MCYNSLPMFYIVLLNILLVPTQSFSNSIVQFRALQVLNYDKILLSVLQTKYTMFYIVLLNILLVPTHSYSIV